MRTLALAGALLAIAAAAGRSAIAQPAAPLPGQPLPSGQPLPQADPELLFAGDFDTCDLSQWPHRQDGGRQDIAAVSSPLATPGSGCSGRFNTGRGDQIGDTSPRNELYRPRDAVCCNEGDERWIRWQVRLDRDWRYGSPDAFSTILQFKSDDASPGQMSFILFGDRLALRRGDERWSTRLTRGRWHDFLLHVVFSARARRGRARLWHDGRRQSVNGGRRFATLANRRGAYLKLGLYRSASLPRASLHHDGLRMGLTRRSVTRGA